MGSHTPPEDLKARFQGAGCGYIRALREIPVPFARSPTEPLESLTKNGTTKVVPFFAFPSDLTFFLYVDDWYYYDWMYSNLFFLSSKVCFSKGTFSFAAMLRNLA